MTQQTADGALYAGDVTPLQAWDLLAQERGAVLVDVRSRPEWSFVGVPDLAKLGKRPVLVAWQHWMPGPQGAAMTPNAAFAEEVAGAAPDRGATTIFICRSGARSRAAAIAMTAQG
jgi:rhodanese-related sulfurtransferase